MISTAKSGTRLDRKQPSTFARVPRLDEVTRCDVAVVGVPFDSGCTYRPGARFGPIAVRQASRLLRNYHPALDAYPFTSRQVADAGDIGCNPFTSRKRSSRSKPGRMRCSSKPRTSFAIGGDHTIALPLLRAFEKRHGPAALLHFDAHLDTFDIDVIDPSAAPGTGTPEAGGLTSRELLGVLRGLKGLRLLAADLVEVAPAYDHAEITAMAASHVAYELPSLLAANGSGMRARP